MKMPQISQQLKVWHMPKTIGQKETTTTRTASGVFKVKRDNNQLSAIGHSNRTDNPSSITNQRHSRQTSWWVYSLFCRCLIVIIIAVVVVVLCSAGLTRFNHYPLHSSLVVCSFIPSWREVRLRIYCFSKIFFGKPLKQNN